MFDIEYEVLEHEIYSDILAEQINLAITVKGSILKFRQNGLSVDRATEIVQGLVDRAADAVSHLDI